MNLAIADALLQLGASVVFVIFMLMAFTSTEPYALLLSFACLIAAVYFLLGAITSMVDGSE